MEKLLAEAITGSTVALPAVAARRLGLSPGAKLNVVVRRGHVEILPDIHSLSLVYLEPTSRCNLACRTCVQRGWGEPPGDMGREVFAKLLTDLRAFPHLESAMLGGFGEPTAHPDILRMISGLKELGLSVELVSNGTLLDEKLSRGLAEAGLDRMWVSFDGADTGNYEQVREGGKFKAVLENVKRLTAAGRVKVGMAFVVTKSNVADLPKLGELARAAGVDRVSVSNVIPYTPEMEKQMLCSLAVSLGTFTTVEGRVNIDLPRLDISVATREALLKLLGNCENISLMGKALSAGADECRFIRERCVFIRWDGQVAPCMALMHDHEIHFRGGVRKNKAHSFGDIAAHGLADIWNAPEYADFRSKVLEFDFSPCQVCGVCNLSETNSEDCGGNLHPAACGGCLWGQGVIQCP